MKKQVLFGLWAGLFSVCAALGFIPSPEGSVRILLTLCAVAVFIPPAVLLYDAAKAKDRRTVLLVRNFSAASLTATALLLVLNFLSVLGSESLGNFLHAMLTVVSSPMVCCGNWALSLFLWACLLMVSLQQLKKIGKNPV